MKIFFSHGKESGPWGSKIKALAEIARNKGLAVESIDYQGIESPDERAEKLIKILDQETEAYLLVGSSMGGYVSVVASQSCKAKGLFLLAPALYLQGYQQQDYQPNGEITVVHGWEDEIIPYANSVTFCQQQDCNLHLIAGDHRLNSSLPVVLPLFEEFINTML